MQPIFLTIFPRAEATLAASKTLKVTWKTVTEQLSEFVYIKDKLAASLLLPVKFADQATSKEKKFVESVYLATLDIDGVKEEEYREVLSFIRAEGYHAVAYTTWGHVDSVRGIGKKGEKIEPSFRARVVIPLSRPVSATEWKYFWTAYNNLFFDLADTNCKDPSRGYFIPTIPKKYENTEIAKLAEVEVIEGEKPLDVDWLLHSYRDVIAEDTGTAGLPDQELASSVDLEEIKAFVSRLKGRKDSSISALGHKMSQGLRGEVFEAVGSQDTTLYKIAQELAKRFPDRKADELARPFQGAISNMAEQSGQGASNTWLRDKILTAQSHVLAEKASKKKQQDQEELAEVRRASVALQNAPEYTRGSVETFLKKNNLDQDADELRLIISYQASYYLFNGDGYEGPYKFPDLILACKVLLELQAKKLGFELYDIEMKDDGPPVKRIKSRDALLTEYGTVAHKILYNLDGTSYYDAVERVIHVSEVQPIRYEAEFIQKVDDWIVGVTKDEEQAESFRNYLSQITNLARALAALCIVGLADAGKSALAAGLAKLWDTVAVPMRVALGDFNGEILQSPIILADEELPRDHKGRVRTEDLRSLISGNTHSVNRKGVPRVNLQGNLRCIVTLNNIDNFDFGHAKHSKQDVEAIQKRFFVLEIPVDTDVSLFDYDLFVTQGGLARHVLHLAATRERASDRFGVETNSRTHIVLGDSSASHIIDWILEYLEAIQTFDDSTLYVQALNMKPVTVLPKSTVFVNVKAMFDDWETFGNIRNRTTQRSLSTSLSSLSCQIESAQFRVTNRKNKYRFWQIDTEILIEQAKKQERDIEQIEKRLEIYHDIDILGEQYKPTDVDAQRRKEAIDYLETRGVKDDDDGS